MLEGKYKNEEKQKELELLNKEAKLKEEKLKRRNFVIFGILLLLILMIILVISFFRQTKIKQ